MISLTPLTNLSNAVPWGLWVSIYTWLIGISAGSFLLVSWGHLKNEAHLKKISRMGITFALSTLLVGLLSIQIDLGHIERFYKLFLSPNPNSIMAWMVWLYAGYFFILILTLHKINAANRKDTTEKEISKPFLKFALIIAFMVIVVESLLFAMPPAKHWHSPIFVLHFISSSLVSGAAALILASGILKSKDKKEVIGGLAKIALPLIFINLFIEVIGMFLNNAIGQIESWILIIANIIVIILLSKRNIASIISASVIELIVILLSKYNDLISAQTIEPFKGFAKAYIEPRLKFYYTPNFFEYLIAVFLIIMLSVGSLFYLLDKVLPSVREE